MDFLLEYGMFLAKAATWVAAILLVVLGLASTLRQVRQQQADHLEVKNLNDRYRDMADTLRHRLLNDAEWKQAEKARKAEDKARDKARKAGTQRPRLFVLDFDGDLQAAGVESLREEVSTVLQVAQAGDEVLLRLESEGGVVHGYGLAASQLQRLRDHGVKLTAAVDKVAASGGYLMACVADRILAAPFAIVGSIGVVAQLPNFNRLLKDKHIDFELHTAGEHKRTLTLFGENTDEGRAKFRESLEEAHALFKAYIAQHRPVVDLQQVATGEHWFGSRALELKLVDELKTSDDYLLDSLKDRDLFEVRYRRHRSVMERLGIGLARLRSRLPL